jgi:hypothetical protein
MSKLGSVEFSLTFVVALALFILDKSGKGSALLNIVLLILMAVFIIHPALQVAWIWSPSQVALRIWRASLCICIVLLAVARFGIWTWPKPTQTVSIRLKYSSRQTVRLSQEPGEYNETINLDNAAILALGDPSDSESVTMLMQSEAPRTITNPKFGQEYRSGKETVVISPVDRGKTEITDLTMSAFSGQFHFDTSANRVQLIRMGDREFRVSLDAINDKSTEGRMLIEYVFGISEQ